MKTKIERRKPQGFVDYLSLAITTVGVGFIPGPPGTYGSAVGCLIYIAACWIYLLAQFMCCYSYVGNLPEWFHANSIAVVSVLLTLLSLLGIWASGRSTHLFGNSDPSQAVIDEVMGQLVTFAFVPFILSWTIILPGFLLFRLFDIWKPYPIDDLQALPGGLGICADDIVAGVYAGICLAVGHAIYLAL